MSNIIYIIYFDCLCIFSQHTPAVNGPKHAASSSSHHPTSFKHAIHNNMKNTSHSNDDRWQHASPLDRRDNMAKSRFV